MYFNNLTQIVFPTNQTSYTQLFYLLPDISYLSTITIGADFPLSVFSGNEVH